MNDCIGKVCSLSILLLCFIVVYEVVRRYVFNSPTIYAFELTVMIFGFHFMLNAAYTLKDDSHVAIDIVHNLFSFKIKIVIDLISYLLFFFPFVTIIFYKSSMFAYVSWAELEKAGSVWSPPVYYIKTVIPITMFLLLLQGISNIIKKLTILIKG
ncbi:MAG: TRAP transporter small permease subunit [Desulfovermiculus sp.]|nr:TRAP transporter small permease subunit [Desulfovermiculus sp.]